MFKKLLIALGLAATVLLPTAALAQVNTHGGGTGLVDIASGAIPFGSVFNIRLGTSTAFTFNNAANRLSVTYASTTALSATTLCLIGDICRTTWPTTGGGGTGNVSTSTNETQGFLAYWTTTSATPALLGKVATSSPTVTAPITYSGTLGAFVGGVGGTFGCTTSSAGVTGCLSGTDWSTFNNKQAAIALGAGTVNSTAGNALYATATSTPAVTAPITYSGTLGQFIAGVSGNFGCTTSSAGVTGCLSGTDWSTFNSKQAAGNYITALTGDVTATGPNSVAATLATVNGNVGSFTNASFTVNAKGLVTAASNGTAPVTSVSGTANQITSSGGVTPTLSLPNHVIFPVDFLATAGSTTNATTTGSQYFTGITASRGLYVDSTGKVGPLGTGTSGNCVQWSSNNTLSDAGAVCGTGGGGVTAVAATYPILTTGSTGSITLSTAFGTTTQNNFSLQNTFASLFSTISSSTNATTTNFEFTGKMRYPGNFNNNFVGVDANGFANPVAAGPCSGGSFLITITGNGATCGSPTATYPMSYGAGVISTSFSTTTNNGMAQGIQYTGSGGIWQSAASSSIFGFTPASNAVTVTVAGTANQLTSSNGAAQALTGNVSTTLSFPNHLIFPLDFLVTNSTTTNATTTGSAYFTGITASRPLYVDSTGKLGSAGSGVSGNCVNWGANNTFGDAGAACGTGGATFGWPFTPQSYGNSTTSVIAFTTGLISGGSTTISTLGTGFVQSTNGLLSSASLTSGNITTALGFTPFGGTNPLPIVNGGTGLTAVGASSTVAITNATSISWQQILFNEIGGLLNLASQVTGILPVANGGTNASVLGAGLFTNGTTLSQIEHPSFTYATSTAWTGTTTIPIQVGYGEVFNSIRCYTDTGTLNVQIGIGSASTTMLNASTTIGTVSYSSNNTMTAGSSVKVDLGTPASTPTKINCTVTDTN